MVLPFLFIRGGRTIATKVREAHLKALGKGTPLRRIDEEGKPESKQFYTVEADEHHQVWLCWKSGFPIPRKHKMQVLATPVVEPAKSADARAHIVLKTPDGDWTLEAPKDTDAFELWTRKFSELIADQAALQGGEKGEGDEEIGGVGVEEKAEK